MDSGEKIENAIALDSAENRISAMLEDESELALEALLFAAPDPLSDKEIGKIIGKNTKEIPGIIAAVVEHHRYHSVFVHHQPRMKLVAAVAVSIVIEADP